MGRLNEESNEFDARNLQTWRKDLGLTESKEIAMPVHLAQDSGNSVVLEGIAIALAG